MIYQSQNNRSVGAAVPEHSKLRRFPIIHSIVILDSQSVHCKNKDGNIIDTFRRGILMGYPSGARIKNDTTG